MGRPRQQRAQDSSDAILGAAQGLFVSQGYRFTTVDQIAATAGLSKGAVYFHFSDKADIVTCLVQQVTEPLVHFLDELSTQGLPPLERLVRFLHRQATLSLENPYQLLLPVLMSIEFQGTGSETERAVCQLYGHMRTFLLETLEQGRADGTFARGGHIREQVATVIAVHDGMLVEWLRNRDELDGTDLVRAMRQTLLHGLLVRER